jgi:hypothetical protein
MSAKSFEPNKEESVVRQFSSGVEAWERPLQAGGPEEGIPRRGAAKTRGEVWVRGAVRTRGRNQPHSPGKLPPVPLPERDLVVGQFQEAVIKWERPFERGGRQD